MNTSKLIIAICFFLSCSSQREATRRAAEPNVTIRITDEFAEPAESVSDTTIPPAIILSTEQGPRILKRVEPSYPEKAIRSGMQGDVLMQAWITQNGRVRRAIVKKSTDTIFNQPSLRAVLRWEFDSPVVNGQPSDIWLEIPFKFRVQTR